MCAQLLKLRVARALFWWKLPFSLLFFFNIFISPLLFLLSLSPFLHYESFSPLISSNFNCFFPSLLVLNFSLLSSSKWWCFKKFLLVFIQFFLLWSHRKHYFFSVVFNGHSGPNSKFSHWCPVPGIEKTVSCIFINFFQGCFPSIFFF